MSVEMTPAFEEALALYPVTSVIVVAMAGHAAVDVGTSLFVELPLA